MIRLNREIKYSRKKNSNFKVKNGNERILPIRSTHSPDLPLSLPRYDTSTSLVLSQVVLLGTTVRPTVTINLKGIFKPTTGWSKVECHQSKYHT